VQEARVQEAGSGDADAERQPGGTSRRRDVVAAFLAASREGDFGALLEMLDPDIVLRADAAAVQMGVDSEVTGAQAVAGMFCGRAKALRPALIDGAPGLVWTHRGETRVVFAFAVSGDTITAIEQIADPERIARLGVVLLKAGLGPRPV
jgi:RNA polymerase sigma-70 factor (ECF subfamily)